MALPQRIELICDHYRKAWRGGKSRPIEEILASADPHERAELLVQLIVVEAELRSESGDLATLEEFEQRFPEDRPSVAQAMFVIHQRIRTAGLEETRRFSADSSQRDGERPNGSSSNALREARLAEPQHALGDYENYELLEEIGRGGMGVVYKARQKHLGRIVALKLIRPDQSPRADEIQRFEREAAAAARLDHPGIIAVYDAGKHDGWPYYAMAYVPGRSLAQHLGDGCLLPVEAARLAKQISDAIGYAHRQGVIHRDLKPANILLDSDGRTRVADFGLAKLLDPSMRITASGMVMGSFPFMSPEQALGRHDQIGPATDIYAIGVILYTMPVGRPPFMGKDPVSVLDQVKHDSPVPVAAFRSDVPASLQEILQRCMNKSPERRYKTAEELSAKLQSFLDGSYQSTRGWRGAWNRLKHHVLPAIAGYGPGALPSARQRWVVQCLTYVGAGVALVAALAAVAWIIIHL